MKIQIAGQEDVFQKELLKNVLDVLKELQRGCELEVVREIKEILEMEKRNILITPALIVNGHILCEGTSGPKTISSISREKPPRGNLEKASCRDIP